MKNLMFLASLCLSGMLSTAPVNAKGGRLTGKVVIITGASKGIGKSIVVDGGQLLPESHHLEY